MIRAKAPLATYTATFSKMLGKSTRIITSLRIDPRHPNSPRHKGLNGRQMRTARITEGWIIYGNFSPAAAATISIYVQHCSYVQYIYHMHIHTVYVYMYVFLAHTYTLTVCMI